MNGQRRWSARGDSGDTAAGLESALGMVLDFNSADAPLVCNL